MKLRVSLIAALLLCLPGLAMADGVATIALDEDQSMQLAWQGEQTVRMEVGQADSYMLLRDGSVYSVTNTSGTPRVMNLTSMMKAFGAAAAQQNGGNSPFGDAHVEKVVDTGKTRTVAGITGKVYQVTAVDADGTTRTTETVLTDNPLVVEMTRAYLGGFMSAFAESDDKFQETMAALPGDMKGILASGDGYAIQSISADVPSADYFALPAKPKDLGGMLQSIMSGRQN